METELFETNDNKNVIFNFTEKGTIMDRIVIEESPLQRAFEDVQLNSIKCGNHTSVITTDKAIEIIENLESELWAFYRREIQCHSHL